MEEPPCPPDLKAKIQKVAEAVHKHPQLEDTLRMKHDASDFPFLFGGRGMTYYIYYRSKLVDGSSKRKAEFQMPNPKKPRLQNESSSRSSRWGGRSQAPPQPILPKYKKNDQVVRKGEVCTVIHVDEINQPPSYTVKINSTGQILGTEESYLSPLSSISNNRPFPPAPESDPTVQSRHQRWSNPDSGVSSNQLYSRKATAAATPSSSRQSRWGSKDSAVPTSPPKPTPVPAPAPAADPMAAKQAEIQARIKAVAAKLAKQIPQANTGSNSTNGHGGNPISTLDPDEANLTDSQRKMRAFMANLESQDSATQRTFVPKPRTYEEVGGVEPRVGLPPGFKMGKGGRGYRGKKKGAPRANPNAGKKLNSQNKGFALLKKLGWKEGSGIGVNREGRVNPVMAKARSRFKS